MRLGRAASLAAVTGLTGLALAKPYADRAAPAQPTDVADSVFGVNGWTPAPTAAAAANPLQRRADDPRVCGLDGYDLEDIHGQYLQCALPTDTCILNGTDRAHSCCGASVAPLGGWINCNSFTACLAGAAAAAVLRTASPRGTAFCVGSAPFCASYSWTQPQLAGLTAYGCDSRDHGIDIWGSATGSGARASLFSSASAAGPGSPATTTTTTTTTTTGAAAASSSPPSSASAAPEPPSGNGACDAAGAPAVWTVVVLALVSALFGPSTLVDAGAIASAQHAQ